MGRTACTGPQCLYKGALYLYLTVELYLYSPCGLYGLYRASVPVQGCTLPLPYSRAIPLLPLWAVRPVQSLSDYKGALYLYLSKASLSRDAPTGLTFNNCTFCPHCICVFCIYLRTNSDLCHLQHKLIGFYNRDEKCLLRGMDWVFK